MTETLPRAHPRRRKRDRLALDQDAGTQKIVHALKRDWRHADGAVRQRLQRLFGDQPAERLAHRHGAGHQRIGETANGQHLARLEQAADQRSAKLRIDAVLHGLATNRRELSGDGVVAFLDGGLLHGLPAFDLQRRLKLISVINTSVITNQKSEDDNDRLRPEGSMSALSERREEDTRTPVLTAKNVVRRFGGVAAVNDVSFDVRQRRNSRTDRPERRRQDDDVRSACRQRPADVSGEIMLNGVDRVRRSRRTAASAAVWAAPFRSPAPFRT